LTGCFATVALQCNKKQQDGSLLLFTILFADPSFMIAKPTNMIASSYWQQGHGVTKGSGIPRSALKEAFPNSEGGKQ